MAHIVAFKPHSVDPKIDRLSSASPSHAMTQFAKETLPISLEEEMRRSYLD